MKQIFRIRDFPVAMAFTITLIVTLTVVVANRVNDYLAYSARAEAVEAANLDADSVAAAMQRELIKIDVIARAIRLSVELNPRLDQDTYGAIVAPLIANTPAVSVVGRSRGYQLDLIYPLVGNESAVGLDYRKLPGQFGAVDRVMRTGKTTLIGPVDLIQGGTAFILRTPYYTDTTWDMSRSASGIISIVIDRDRLMSQISNDHGIENYDIALRKLWPSAGPGATLYGPETVFDNQPVLRELPVAGGYWQLGLAPTSGWPQAARAEGLVWALSALACTLLCAVVLALWAMYRSKRIAESQLRSAINSIDDGFALYDPDDRLVFVNEKYLSYYELSRDAIYPGNTFENILREGLKNGQYKDAIGDEEAWLKERLHKHFNPTAPIEQKLGDGRWLKIAESRSPEGNTVGFRVDITELKQAREKAEAANQAKNNFLNIISHELRTPLTSVIGYARFLENVDVLPGFKRLHQVLTGPGATDEERLRALDAMRADVAAMSGRITTASDHLLGLINDVLDRAKLEAETIELSVEPVDIKTVVEAVTTNLGIKAAEKGIELETDVAALPITADPKRLRQALINVVGNAIKFTETGGVYVTSDHDDTHVHVYVRDTGCGIPEDQVEQIFQKFVQVDTSVTRRNSGTGLGLAITRELIELHGGTVTVDSEMGAGSTFTISLPFKARKVELAA